MKKKIIYVCCLLGLMAMACSCGKQADDRQESAVSVTENDTRKEEGLSDVSDNELSEEAEDTSLKESSEGTDKDASETVADDAEKADETLEESSEDAGKSSEDTVSDEDALYVLKTSEGSNLGMAPIVAGNAVVLLPQGDSAVLQGDYVTEDMRALQEKVEAENIKAVSAGKIEDWAFYREPLLRSYKWQEGITSIGRFAFARSGLDSIEIPEGVTTIEYSAFYHCDNLTRVSVPESVTSIEENAFAYTPWLQNWLEGGTEEEDDFLIVGDGILLAYRGEEKNPELPKNVKTIAAGAIPQE